MKTTDIGLNFDDKLSKTAWAGIHLADGSPSKLWYGTSLSDLGATTIVGSGDDICYLGFEESRSLEKCRNFYRHAEFIEDTDRAKSMVKKILDIWEGRVSGDVNLIVKGTAFQKKVWNALMYIPTGHVVSYGTIAKSIGSPAAVRAVGSAVGTNPVSLLIPCHRVVQQSGKVENYGWGDAIKKKLLQQEVSIRTKGRV